MKITATVATSNGMPARSHRGWQVIEALKSGPDF